MNFLVDLDIFRGPLDLLLYLVRKHEVEITEIPIAPITDQFLEYLAVLEQLDVDAVGDFLDVASTLVEIKSRMVLPRSEEIEDPLEDPRRELVERLLAHAIAVVSSGAGPAARTTRFQEHRSDPAPPATSR